MFNKNLKLEVALSEINNSLRNISHKQGNQADSINNLTKLVYSDSGSIINKLSLLTQQIDNLTDDINHQNNQLSKQSDLIDKLENRVDKAEGYITNLQEKASNNQKLVALIIAAMVSFLVPYYLNKLLSNSSEPATTNSTTEASSVSQNIG